MKMALAAVISLVLVSLAAKTNAQCRHTLIAQKGLRVNTVEDIYVDFHDCPETVTVVASLTSLPERTNIHDSARIVNHNHANRPVKVSLQAESNFIENTEEGNPVFQAELEVKYCFGEGCGEPWTEIPIVTILLNNTHGYVLMTTDRPAYRPGEKVKMALALTNQDLKPEAERRPLKVFVKTPDDKGRIIVHDSKELFVRPNGFLEYEYQIPSTPMEGIWWAEVHTDGIKMAEKSFVIDRYELPTFQVKILPQYHFMLETMTHIRGEVLAEYSYGEKVNGVYYMSFSLKRPDGTEEEFHKIPERFGLEASISRGSVDYAVPVEKLQAILKRGETIREFVDTDARIIITASVTGLAESVFESDVVEDIVFTRSPFVVDFSQSAKFFVPNTIYAMRATIRDAYSLLPLPDIRATITWGPQRRSREIISDKNGEIYHEIDSFRENIEHVTIRTDNDDFDAVEQFQADFDVRKYTPTRTLGLRLRKQVADVGEEQNINFDIGDSRPTNIRFFVVARGQFTYADTKIIDDDGAVGQNREVAASFPVEASMVPNARVVAYYILDGELTSNSAWFDVTNQCETELTITPDKESVEPGGKIGIELSGAPNAIVLAMAVDRAAYFVHNGTRVNRQQLWSKMAAYDTACSRRGGRDATSVFEEAGLSFNSPLTQSKPYENMYCESARKKRNAQPTPEQVRIGKLQNCRRDGQRKDFRPLSCDQRLVIVRDSLIDLKSPEDFINDCCREFYDACQSRKLTSPLGRAAGNARDKANEVRARKRVNFAERMFFFLRTLRANGKDKIQTTATDSITYYDIDAFGMSNRSPMCVAETKSIKVFTEFFIQLYLPYSLKVREQAEIRFSLFNYGNRPEQVDVFIRHSKDLCSRQQAVKQFQHLISLSVDGNSAKSATFTVLPLRVPQQGTATIELKAGNDYIEREILIEDEGQRNESSKTIVLEEGENGAASHKTMIFDIPERSVMPTTKSCSLYAYAHPMGPSIEINTFDERLQNMDNYIKLPNYCGEQNMIRIGPTVYVHKYRVEVYGGAVTEEQWTQVREHIQRAYGIELKWRSDQVGHRAFAVWNTKPPSTWLNAFVTKVFAAAREFWQALDTQPICNALEWLIETQNDDDGYFEENYRVHHREMRGFVVDKISLTAYVSISLVETASACPHMSTQILESADNANAYLKAHLADAIGTPYTLAMGAYALAVSEPDSAEAQRWNELLRDSRREEEEYIFWKGTRGKAADIETTAYGLLAEVTLNGITPDNDWLTRSVSRWLISQRNANGGFVSTQDTVVALQALSTYMKVLETSVREAPQETNLHVEIRSHEENDELAQLDLTSENTMRRTDIEIDGGQLASVGGVRVTVSGEGTGSLAYRCTWRQYSDDGRCSFNIDVRVEEDREIAENEKILRVFVSKPDLPKAQMSIVDVGILSGYEPDRGSIEKLTKSVDRSADRYEITENTIKFYLNDIDSDGMWLAFKITEVAPVQNRQPASVSAYDYYEPEIRCTRFYTADGDYRLRTTNCERGNAEMCKCAEGSCPICRTREEQLTDTICSNHRLAAGRRNACQISRMCRKDTRSDCYNLHRRTCDSAYLYVVNVLEIGDDESGSKYFLARIDEAIRESAVHQGAQDSVAKFTMRRDCFDKCKDERLARLAASNYISVGRTLLVYGSQPGVDRSEDPPRYVYDITEGGGMEITLSKDKCQKFLNPNKKRGGKNENQKRKICKLKAVLREAHHLGCD